LPAEEGREESVWWLTTSLQGDFYHGTLMKLGRCGCASHPAMEALRRRAFTPVCSRWGQPYMVVPRRAEGGPSWVRYRSSLQEARGQFLRRHRGTLANPPRATCSGLSTWGDTHDTPLFRLRRLASRECAGTKIGRHPGVGHRQLLETYD
jgi:hypothetical protein